MSRVDTTLRQWCPACMKATVTVRCSNGDDACKECGGPCHCDTAEDEW